MSSPSRSYILTWHRKCRWFYKVCTRIIQGCTGSRFWRLAASGPPVPLLGLESVRRTAQWCTCIWYDLNPAIYTYATSLRARTYTTAVLLADSSLGDGTGGLLAAGRWERLAVHPWRIYVFHVFMIRDHKSDSEKERLWVTAVYDGSINLILYVTIASICQSPSLLHSKCKYRINLVMRLINYCFIRISWNITST